MKKTQNCEKSRKIPATIDSLPKPTVLKTTKGNTAQKYASFKILKRGESTSLA